MSDAPGSHGQDRGRGIWTQRHSRSGFLGDGILCEVLLGTMVYVSQKHDFLILLSMTFQA